MNKSVDGNLLKYGISSNDLKIIQSVCQASDIDNEWLEETILAPLHQKRTSGESIDATDAYKIIQAALKDI